MSQQTFSREEIRRAVREALLEALPAEKTAAREHSRPNSVLMKKIMESVKANCKTPVAVDLSSDQKVNRFAIDLAKCVQDRGVDGMIRSGRLKFQSTTRTDSFSPLKQTATSASNHHQPAQQQNAALTNGRIESGVLTESKILALAKSYQRIEVSKKVILTPLAKDRARRMKIEIVRL